MLGRGNIKCEGLRQHWACLVCRVQRKDHRARVCVKAGMWEGKLEEAGCGRLRQEYLKCKFSLGNIVRPLSKNKQKIKTKTYLPSSTG